MLQVVVCPSAVPNSSQIGPVVFACCHVKQIGKHFIISIILSTC